MDNWYLPAEKPRSWGWLVCVCGVWMRGHTEEYGQRGDETVYMVSVVSEVVGG
jgi:hypothetical protein